MLPKRQYRPSTSKPQDHSLKDPSRPSREASRDRLFKAEAAGSRACAAANQEPKHHRKRPGQPTAPQAMADGALMAAPSPPHQSTTPEQAHKTAVPPTPSRLKWFGSQITEDNLNVDYVSNSLREEDRKPEISQRPRPQPLSKLTSWLGWSRSTINDDESSQSSPKRSASPSFFKSFRRSQSPTHDDTSDKSSNTHGSQQDLELLAAQEAALEAAGGAAVEQGHKLQHYCRGPRPDACRSDRGKLDWYDFLADTELCTMHFDALEGTDAMKLNIVLRLLENCKVPSTLKLSPATLKAFAGDVWQDMHPHPYHNFSHATDVAQSFYSILIATRLVKSLDAITVAASILAALCHDLDHPGYTNQYQENERTELWSVWKSTRASGASSGSATLAGSSSTTATSRALTEEEPSYDEAEMLKITPRQYEVLVLLARCGRRSSSAQPAGRLGPQRAGECSRRCTVRCPAKA